MRRWIPLAAVALAVALVAAVPAIGGATSSADRADAAVVAAAAAGPSIRVVPGDRTLTVAWKAVPGARSYQVKYGAKASMAGAKVVSTSSLVKMISGLANSRTYYVQVVAVTATGKLASAATSAQPTAGYPTAVTVKAVPAGVDEVRLSWTAQKRGTKVAVIAGSEGGLTRHPFNTGFFPVTTTSVTITIPQSLRALLGSGSGNPVFFKVATYNDASAGTALPRVADPGRAYRLSPAGVYSYAGSETPDVPTVRIAEWNVNSVAASRGIAGHTWRDRRAAVVNGIVKSGASVFVSAELTTADAGVGGGVTQWQDLANLLRPKGFAAANDPGPAGANATKGAHVFYKTSVLTRLDGGLISPKSLGIGWPPGLVDRYASWAKFQVVATGEVFFVLAAHFPPNAGSANYSKLRVAEAQALDRFISSKAGQHTVVMAGDFNSTFLSNGADPAVTLRKVGYYDASATPTRSNDRYPTANLTNQIDNKQAPGYPLTPYKYKYPAPRIDYIMLKNSAGSAAYSNQIVLKSGTFDSAYQGSDHNLQWADVAIRSSDSGWLRCSGNC